MAGETPLPHDTGLALIGVTKRYPRPAPFSPFAGGPSVDELDDDIVDLDAEDDEVETAPAPEDILTDVQLTLPRGAALGIVGAQGAGKTTLIRLLAGTLRPTAGTIAVRGPVAPPAAGLVRHLEPDHTIDANLRLLAVLIGVSPAPAADTTLELAGVQRTGATRWGALDRVDQLAIVEAALLQLRVGLHLFDPAMKIASPDVRDALDGVLAERLADGACAVFTARRVERLPPICSGIALLNAGRLCAWEEPEAAAETDAAAERTVARAKFAAESDLVAIEDVRASAHTDGTRITLSYMAREPLESVMVRVSVLPGAGPAQRFAFQHSEVSAGDRETATLHLPHGALVAGDHLVRIGLLATAGSDLHTVLWPDALPISLDTPAGEEPVRPSPRWS
ncbi:ATP-binding cassette domain-containing protein [Svornostia abyssi]|uniref:ATP-binding cassette domain-containing protein n=1 Tax=Svornostia abyssi TaxID=2898438 RepID=A0ABY5PMN6_9ACTN|nr:ATP-binding cassette domain-containing protein [Parviterribacteraceae bacterium J379]